MGCHKALGECFGSSPYGDPFCCAYASPHPTVRYHPEPRQCSSKSQSEAFNEHLTILEDMKEMMRATIVDQAKDHSRIEERMKSLEENIEAGMSHLAVRLAVLERNVAVVEAKVDCSFVSCSSEGEEEEAQDMWHSEADSLDEDEESSGEGETSITPSLRLELESTTGGGQVDFCLTMCDKASSEESKGITIDPQEEQASESERKAQIPEATAGTLIGNETDANIKQAEVEPELSTIRITGVSRDQRREKAERQSEAYTSICQALATMGDTNECRFLLEYDGIFKEQYVNMLLSVEWYETREHLIASGKPLPRFMLPHEYPYSRTKPISGRKELMLGGQPLNPFRAEEFKGPSVCALPCLVEGVPFPRSIIDLRSSHNTMTLTSFEKLQGAHAMNLRTYESPKDPALRRCIGIAKDLTVTLQGRDMHADFFIIDTGPECSDQVTLGEPLYHSYAPCSTNRLELDEQERLDDYFGWKNPISRYLGEPCNYTTALFFRDLARVVNEKTAELSGKTQRVDIARIDELLALKKKYRDRFVLTDEPPDFRRLELLDEAGPSTGQTRDPKSIFNGVGTQAGKTNTDSEGENKPPDREHDSGDNSTVHPGHSHTS